MNDLSEEFLEYVEHSDDNTAEKAKGTLVKKIHKRVIEVKSDVSMEVEFMTLLERDREKIEEGRLEEKLDIARNLLDVLDDETISKKTGLSIEEVKKLREKI